MRLADQSEENGRELPREAFDWLCERCKEDDVYREVGTIAEALAQWPK